MRNFIDIGVDLDFDGHCDLCGKFVDELGHHRSSLIFDEEFQYSSDIATFQQIIEGSYDDDIDLYLFTQHFFTANPYQNRFNYSSSVYWEDVRDYTVPDITTLYSGTSMNYYLRTGKLRNIGENVLIMQNKINGIKAAINDFEVKRTIVTYRGLTTTRDDKLCQTLDEAFNRLKQEKTTPFMDKGFISTSISLKYAFKLGNTTDECNNTSIMFAIVAPKGTKCMPLSETFETTIYPKEKEVLFNAGQKFDIIAMSRRHKNGVYKYRVILLAKED